MATAILVKTRVIKKSKHKELLYVAQCSSAHCCCRVGVCPGCGTEHRAGPRSYSPRPHSVPLFAYPLLQEIVRGSRGLRWCEARERCSPRAEPATAQPREPKPYRGGFLFFLFHRLVFCIEITGAPHLPLQQCPAIPCSYGYGILLPIVPVIANLSALRRARERRKRKKKSPIFTLCSKDLLEVNPNSSLNLLLQSSDSLYNIAGIRELHDFLETPYKEPQRDLI